MIDDFSRIKFETLASNVFASVKILFASSLFNSGKVSSSNIFAKSLSFALSGAAFAFFSASCFALSSAAAFASASFFAFCSASAFAFSSASNFSFASRSRWFVLLFN